MSKRGGGQKKSGEGDFSYLRIDEDLERRKKRREKKIAEKKEGQKGGTWQQEIEEAGREVREKAKKEKQTRIAALYSDLRIDYDSGKLTDEEVVEYLKDFPFDAEYQAFEEVNDLIRRGEIGKEIKKMQTRTKVGLKRLQNARLTNQEKMRQKKSEALRKAVTGRVGKEGSSPSSETEKDIFSAEEWKDAILREYADGKISDEDIKDFFEYYQGDKKEAYDKLAGEEGIRIGEAADLKDELSQEEIEEMLLRGLGFREELVKDIPTKEGKTIFEEMLDEQVESFKQILRGTISREDLEKKTAELGGDREKAEKELIAEAGKKFLAVRELFTHGILGYDREKGKIVLGRYSDLDGKCAMGLFGKAGIDISKTEYLKPGEYKKGQITVDSGERDGLVFESTETVDPETGERKKELTTFFDHHGPYSDRDTSATKTVYKVLNELGLLKFKDKKEEERYDKVVEWVTQSDNLNFPGMEKYFDTSDRRMIGFLKFSNFDRLLRFAEMGKKITDILSDREMERLGINYKDRKSGKFIDRSGERREVIEKAKRKVRELSSRGFLIAAKDGKKFLIDTTGEAGGEFQWAAASLGYDGIIRYTPDLHGFMVAQNKGKFDPKVFDNLPQGKLMRGNMFLQPMGRGKLEVTLSDLIESMAPDFKPGPKTELRRFLDNEPRRIRAAVSRAPEGWWWTNAPDGTKVVVRGLPEGFKSGDEAYLVLREPREIRPDEERKYGGDFYIGYWESDEIIPPKKPEVKAVRPKLEVKKPEIKKQPVRVEVKKSVAPEVKSPPPAKPEIKPVAPKAEGVRTPEERKKIEEEIASGKKEIWNKAFEKIMGTLEASPVWGKRPEEERRNVAKNAADIEARNFEQSQRKKYGI